MTPEITSPSRRQIAKGAAWAVPAVAVAATAPSLAASPTGACEPGDSTLEISVVRCTGITVLGSPPHFVLKNADAATCTLPAGTPVTLSGSGVADINLLGENLANAGVLYSDSGSVALKNDLAPGQDVVINVFPPGINVRLLGNVTLNVDGAQRGMNLTAAVPGLIAICNPA